MTLTHYRYCLPAELYFSILAETPVQAAELAAEFDSYLAGGGLDVVANTDYQLHHRMAVYPDEVGNSTCESEDTVLGDDSPTQSLAVLQEPHL
jgi:hypothetical protein